MEEVKHTKRHNTTNCIVCGNEFTYQRRTMKYCSNSCKCRAYQDRNYSSLKVNRSIGAINKMTNEKLITINPKELRTNEQNPGDLINQQKKIINEQSMAIQYILRKYDELHNELLRINDMHMEDKKSLYQQIDSLRAENQSIKRNLINREDQMIGEIIKAGISAFSKK